MARSEHVVGLDIGTSKVCAIIGQLNEDEEIEIVGVGETKSEGLRKGMVVNVEATVRNIEKAINEAEMMSGMEVDRVYVGIAGGHIQGTSHKSIIAIPSGGKEITKQDVSRVLESAAAVCVPPDRELIQVIPQDFKVDGQDGIKDPVGMKGIKLEADVYVITAAISAAQNLVGSVHKAGFDVEDIVLEPVASSYSTLTEDEKELGVVLIDIGGGTTDVAIFLNGSILHTYVVALGGDYVTRDVSVCLRTPLAEAERIKINYGSALPEIVDEQELIDVPLVGGRETVKRSRRELANIIYPRMEEIFNIVNFELKKTGYEEQLAAGIVLTGGASAIAGAVDLAEKCFEMPVRIGDPRGISKSGLVDIVTNPKYATGVGLVKYGFETELKGERRGGYFAPDGNLFRTITKRIKETFTNWFSDIL